MAKVRDPIVLESDRRETNAEEQVKIVRENPRVARLGEKSYAYKRRRDLTFEVNDFVYPKLAPVYIGPFKVLEKKGVVAYKLELPPGLTGVHDVFHVSRAEEVFEGTGRRGTPGGPRCTGRPNIHRASKFLIRRKSYREQEDQNVRVRWKHHTKRRLLGKEKKR
ncbi:LOW QUALITY PROTEIN: hypothetical protein U9M48_000530 [Paspalum notatum var. saurae]|uniref:Tf2-1-like SH3-like domain-containing protein n=1 Tax=Paspalum notatum var. saurae TaxID=547442 RepID=A0AAQ3PKD1_PASNO